MASTDIEARVSKSAVGMGDVNDISDEMIETLLQQAELNLSSTSVDNLPMSQSTPNSVILSKGNLYSTRRGATVFPKEASSDVETSHDGVVKRLSPPLSRRQKEKIAQSTAGEKWFDMPATELTPTVKRDLTLLQMRDVLDPKRHYRSSAKNLPKHFQMGTIVESPTEFFSARIKKKDRKETIVQELLADQKSREYFKKKYNEIQEKSTSGGKKWYRQMQERKKRR